MPTSTTLHESTVVPKATIEHPILAADDDCSDLYFSSRPIQVTLSDPNSVKTSLDEEVCRFIKKQGFKPNNTYSNIKIAAGIASQFNHSRIK